MRHFLTRTTFFLYSIYSSKQLIIYLSYIIIINNIIKAYCFNVIPRDLRTPETEQQGSTDMAAPGGSSSSLSDHVIQVP